MFLLDLWMPIHLQQWLILCNLCSFIFLLVLEWCLCLYYSLHLKVLFCIILFFVWLLVLSLNVPFFRAFPFYYLVTSLYVSFYYLVFFKLSDILFPWVLGFCVCDSGFLYYCLFWGYFTTNTSHYWFWFRILDDIGPSYFNGSLASLLHFASDTWSMFWLVTVCPFSLFDYVEFCEYVLFLWSSALCWSFHVRCGSYCSS